MKQLINTMNEIKNNGTVKYSLARTRLEQKGFIKHLGYGKYELTANGIKALRIFS
jgi:Mn-dependent DtxR family transcriptional regulator